MDLCHYVSKRVKVALDNQVISYMDDIADALSDHFSVEEELKLESYQLVKKYQYESRRDGSPVLNVGS